MKILAGLVASRGAVVGSTVLYAPAEIRIEKRSINDVTAEQEQVRSAMARAAEALARTTAVVRETAGAELAHIFRSQQTIAEDDSIVDEMLTAVSEDRCSAAEAVDKVFGAYIGLFAELADDDYNAQRAADVEDVRRRVLRIALGLPEADLSAIDAGSIIVAEELFPSDTAMIDPSHVVGIATERGGLTSHVAILSKSLGIPAAVGVRNLCQDVSTGTKLALDAIDERNAWVLVDPDDRSIAALEEVNSRYAAYREEITTVVGEKGTLLDGHEIQVSANVGSDRDAVAAASDGATSIGLFRTEFLYLNATREPDEETQYAAYRTAVEAMAPGMVIFRTMDIGGDKSVPFLKVDPEDNPFLGLRALRISFRDPEMLKTQLRAILRASAHGDAKVMFPMVGSVREVIRARELFEEARAELTKAGVAIADHVDVGVMIEVPSAVFMAREIAAQVDFMSVGTNDLTQYILAADRTNGSVADYYQPFHPAVVRAIRDVVDAGNAAGIWTGVCGELAGVARAIPLLIGLGVRELSMSAGLIPEALYTMRRQEYATLTGFAERACACATVDEMQQVLDETSVGFRPGVEGRVWATQSES